MPWDALICSLSLRFCMKWQGNPFKCMMGTDTIRPSLLPIGWRGCYRPPGVLHGIYDLSFKYTIYLLLYNIYIYMIYSPKIHPRWQKNKNTVGFHVNFWPKIFGDIIRLSCIWLKRFLFLAKFRTFHFFWSRWFLWGFLGKFEQNPPVPFNIEPMRVWHHMKIPCADRFYVCFGTRSFHVPTKEWKKCAEPL